MKLLEDAALDVRFALRMARRAPGLTALAVLSIALGVGATTSIFSLVKGVVVDQLSYDRPERVVALSEITPGNPTTDGVGGWTANEWRTRSGSFESVSLYGDGQRVLIENDRAEVLRGMRVSHDFFKTLGVKLLLGRGFLAEDDGSPRNNVIILSYGLWVRRFGGDPHIIGRALNLSTEMYRVIGVLPPDFYPVRMSNPAERPAIFMPLGYDPREASTCRTCFGGSAIGRLKPGVDIRQASAELNSIMREIVRENPAEFPRDTSVLIEPLRNRVIGSIPTALWALMGASTLLLLIVCANVANLMLARATGRAKEVAIRAALGCTRARLASQFFVESLLVSAVGGTLGTLLAWRGIAVLKSLAPRELPRLDEVRMGTPILLFAIGITLLTGLLFGIVPAIRAAGGRLTIHRTHSRLRNLLVVAEVALAFLLAVGTGLLAKSFLRLTGVDAGFDPHHVFTLTLTVTGDRYDSHSNLLEYYRRVTESIRAQPGVMGVAMADNVPLTRTSTGELWIESEPSLSDSETPSADMFWASPDYFRVLHIPLKRGRFFTDRDGVNGPPIAIISESLAASRFPGSNPIGRRIALGPQQDRNPWLTIVGIVGDVRNEGLDRVPDNVVYIPQSINFAHYTRLLVRTTGNPTNFRQSILAAIRSVDPQQAVFHEQSMDAYVASSLAYRSFTLTLVSLFGTFAVLLAVMGVYGVVSYVVGLRTREVGIRIAVGASRSEILKLILRDVLALLALGLTAGLVAALALTRFLSHLLFEVRPNDLATTVSVACFLSLVALLAGYFPARRASAIDPNHALRSD